MSAKASRTTDEILDAALSLLRERRTITICTVAKRLKTSPQGIIQHYPTLDVLRNETRSAAWNLYNARMAETAAEPDPFYGLALAHIRFAQQEPALYRFLFLAPVSAAEPAPFQRVMELRRCLTRTVPLKEEAADRYFRDLWLMANGIASLLATGERPGSEEETTALLAECSLGLYRFLRETNDFPKGGALFQPRSGAGGYAKTPPAAE